MTEPATPDFALNDDGTVTIVAGSVTHRLRRPTIGQLRKLTETQRHLVEESVRSLTKMATIPKPDPDEHDGEDAEASTERYATERLAEQAGRQKIDDEYETLILEWVRDAMVRLSDRDGDVPAVDDLPAFCIDRTIPVRLLNHWRSVPLVPGG